MYAFRTDVRIRFTAIFEWIVAALFLCATVAVASLIVRALVTPVRPVILTLAPAEPVRPPSVSAGAPSVPELPLPGGRALRMGATLSSTATLLGRAAETGRQESDPGRFGERLTRFYDFHDTHFALVFEPFERNGEPRLAAIYMIR